MNDIGKTNLLSAMRYLFDRDMRRNDLVETDYFGRNTSKPIEIFVSLSIAVECPDTQKLRAKLKGSIGSDCNTVCLKLIAAYNEQENSGDIRLLWGGSEDKLVEMGVKGNGYFAIDDVFRVYYINSYVDLHTLFKKNIGALVKKDENSRFEDRAAELAIETKVEEINAEISKLSGVKNFESKLTPSYRRMRDEDISITIKSDFAISHLYSNIVPYIHKDGETGEYPTQGEGRKKLVAYSVYNIIAESTADKKVNLFMIEEPETHLHRSMQAALSHFLFNPKANDNMLNYLFISTHSPFILSDMDNVSLVRIYNCDKIVSGSEMYKVPADWKNSRRKLNRLLSEAVFADFVLLTEGESECILFERVLSQIDPYYESKGIYVIDVKGVGFKPYINILSKLGIKCVVKTDNDITRRKRTNAEKMASKPIPYQTLGFSRINVLVQSINPDAELLLPTKNSLTELDATEEAKRKHYEDNKVTLDNIRSTYNIFLSCCDLEEDLFECLGDRLEELVGSSPVKVLKASKQHNMVELVGKLTDEDCRKIYEHYNFACLKAVQI